MPIIAEAQERLLTAFPKSSNATLVRAVQEGVYLADNLYEGESFLGNMIGHDIRGHIRRVGVSYQIKRYCERGDLPFLAHEKPMPLGRWHWVEIQSTGAIAHICRTDDANSFPDETESRQDVRLRLQTDLFTWDSGKSDFGKIIRSIPTLYAWMTYRIGPGQQLSHLCWVSPAADVDEYVGHIDVLAQVAAVGPVTPTPTTPDPKDKVKLKDHVAILLEKSQDIKSGR
jgi:hypothetical protein